ncbi:MAG TPA: glycoside hydrolase family 2 TIM barrel-domain containing protein, partial [Verrucomicrobiae bacterium]|nr:glycoside hydrolase family 2 TIM barrel-domain containing protein [Verrucomicrobiae bacterium]
GVAMKMKAYCNGHLLGAHEGMFSRFEFNLTPVLQAGTNILSLFVSMEKIPPSTLSMGQAVTVNLTASKVETMSKGMYGPMAPGFPNRAYDLHGIWQPVRLKVCDRAKLEDVWFAPSLSGAEVRVHASQIAGLKPQTAQLKATWTTLPERAVFAEAGPEKIVLDGSAAATLWLAGVKPKLWSPSTPNLYHLQVVLESTNGHALDSWSGDVGFRTFEIRGNRFYLNNHPYWLRGADHLPYGKNPWDKELPRRLVQLLHDANIQITRTHATPWNEAWLDAADSIGLAVSVEGFRPWGLAGKIGPTPPAMFQHWLMENEDLIKRLRNHPSVFIYTIGNEMMLRDSANLEKWRQLSAIVRQTRSIDPTRPIVASSDYERSKEIYQSIIEPNHLDDGDIDDIHRYNNWYAVSSFVTDSRFEAEMKKSQWGRPFIGQEMSTGYPDLDTGLPVLRYTRDLLTPQAWIGESAYPGHDPAIFLEHQRAVTKRWAEQLRYQRGSHTAGFMLFATECWFSHSYDAARVKPYPVYGAIREAWSPVGVALETGRRRFYSGETVQTAVFVTNDSDDFEARSNLDLKISFLKDGSSAEITNVSLAEIPRLDYYETKRLAVAIPIPPVASPRQSMRLCLRLFSGGSEISRSTEPVEIFARPAAEPKIPKEAVAAGLEPELKQCASGYFKNIQTADEPPAAGEKRVLLIGGKEALTRLAAGAPLRKEIEDGATAIVFSPPKTFNTLFSRDILDVKTATAEYADIAPISGIELAKGLRIMDVKWWGRKADERVFIGNQSHRLTASSHARVLLRYIPPHSYISSEKVPAQYRTVLFELPCGRGRIWVCDLDFAASLAVDPVADIFIGNLFRSAAEPDSTSHLPRLRTHEELLKGG